MYGATSFGSASIAFVRAARAGSTDCCSRRSLPRFTHASAYLG